MKRFVFTVLFSLPLMGHAAKLCIAPVSSGNYEIKVGQSSYTLSSSETIKIKNFKPHINTRIVVKENGKAIESFNLKLNTNEKKCIVQNSLYKTWQVFELKPFCKC